MYNTKRVQPTVTKTHEGAKAYKLPYKEELVSILTTGIGNTFYESLGDREKRLMSVIDSIARTDPEFVAKALVYARTVIGQRSVTHLGAAFLAKYLSGNSLGKRFYSKRVRGANAGGIIYRLDDALSILAAYNHLGGKSIPNSMKNGFASALESSDRYELAKYQSKTRGISLVDLVNLTHPKPVEEMSETFKELMEGRLKQFNTVENKNTAAGKEVAKKVKEGKITNDEAKVELAAKKTENFEDLIESKKIGYLSLLRNLRNIIKNDKSKSLLASTIALLTNKAFIRKSLVFPHQIDLALETLLMGGVRIPNELLVALNEAYELSIPNLRDLFPTGRTLVAVDTSGSMFGSWSSGVLINGKKTNRTPIEKAALIGATLVKGIDADLAIFGTSTAGLRYNPVDSVNTIKNLVLREEGSVGHGTHFRSIFDYADDKYDRIFIVSDMQAMTAPKSHRETVYAIDLVGYGNTVFNKSEKVVQIYGYGSDIYESVKTAEVDFKEVLRKIEAINI
jgi:hypothetical protein